MKKILLGSGLLLAATAAAAQLAPTPPVAPMATRDGIQTRAEVVERTRAMFARADANRDGYITQQETQSIRGQMGGKMRSERPMRGQRMGQAGGAPMFDRIDTNRDNMISRDEWTRAEAMRGERRAEGPRPGMDGQQMAMRGRMGGGMMRMADTDRDQRISLAEAQAAALQRFDRADLNRDGRVTRDERQQARQQWKAQRPAAPAAR